jgi:hypothetical protein
MKKTIFTLLAVIAATTMMAQEMLFQKNDKVLNLGIGIGSTLYSGTYYKTKVPPISASFEVGFMDDLFDVENLNLGLGGYVGFTSSKYEYTFFGSNWGWEYSSFIIGARGALHYPVIEKFDTYSGLLLGYNIVTSKSFGTGITGSAAGSGIAYSWFAGGRYYFTDNIAGMVEIGYGIAYLNLGVAIKLAAKESE